ncbi:TlpA disulfide reductase family protein [Xanthobacter sp. VTT E-85241]|uniref:TlpA family protein disulfide reductase n=1 Tax=Xanthobacteraceae TaxID=335928 RepID=UPI0037284F15
MRRFVLPIVALIAMAGPVLAGPPQNLVLRDAPTPVPEFQFTDSDGNVRTLADFRGKVVLLNVWATWCVPCRKEMPTLDRLQASLGGPDFEVVTLSIDRGGSEVVKKFFAEIGIQNLAICVDPSSKVGFALAAAGLPTTLLIDRQGEELGRLIGPAEWDAPEMLAFLKSIIAQRQGRLAAPQQEDEPT